jgi:membrane-associated protease RseP (regulator of RpoE activity)
MLRQFIRNNVTLVSILIFITLFSIVQLYKPLFLYNQDGSIRSFGVGYKNKTIMPIWLFSIILGIFCYLFVLYYLAYPKISFL